MAGGTRWVAVVNPAAGRRPSTRRAAALHARLRAAGVDVQVSEHPDQPAKLARKAFEAGAGVIACGGDGTVGLLAGVAAECDGLLAVAPIGAGNDFARQIGLRGVAGAIALLESGRERRIDLARATVDGERHWFANVATIGFDSEANRWANGVTVLGGTALYVAAVLRTLAVYRPRRFRLQIDDQPPEEHDAWLVAVANGSRYAGGMRIAPAARLDDGLLDVTIVEATPVAEFLRSFPMVFRGTHVQHPAVHTRRGRRIAVTPLEQEDETWGDGERFGRLPATYEVAPAALRLLGPAGSE